VLAFLGVLIVIVAALGLVGAAVFSRFWEQNNRPKELAIQVGEQRYNLGYYSHRATMFLDSIGGRGSQFAQPSLLLPQVSANIIEEGVALQYAADEGVTATPDEVDASIRNKISVAISTPSPAAGASGTDAGQAVASVLAQQKTFESIYRGQLEQSGLNDQEYRSMTLAQLLISKLKDKFKAAVPAAAESIHYEQILVRDPSSADDIVRRLNSGEDFAVIARQLSLDTSTRDKGGDVGWVARGGLDPASEALLFSLPPGAIQKSTSAQGTFVYKIIEKANSRPLEDTMKQRVADQSYTNWLQSKLQSVPVRNELDLTSGNVDKIKWVAGKVFG